MAAVEKAPNITPRKLGFSFSSGFNDSRHTTLWSIHAACQETPVLLSFKTTPLKDFLPYAP